MPRMNNKAGRLLVVSYVLFACFAMLATTSQTKTARSFFRGNAYGFAKVGAMSVGERLSLAAGAQWDSKYEKLGHESYSRWENGDIFETTPKYVDELSRIGREKYGTSLSSASLERHAAHVRGVLDAFQSIPIVSKAIVVDKNGFVAFASKKARMTLTGDAVADSSANLEGCIIQQLGAGSFEKSYVGDHSYSGALGDFTRYPIMCDGKPWGSFVIFYEDSFFDEFGDKQRRRVVWMCIGLLIIGVALARVVETEGRKNG